MKNSLFVRFSKRCGDSSKDTNKARSYRRAACIGNTFIVQDGADIVAYATHKGDGLFEIKVIQCDKQTEYAQYMKRLIGNSAKWTESADTAKRKYKVAVVHDFNGYQFSITKKRIK